jgi:hypothetical protein
MAVRSTLSGARPILLPSNLARRIPAFTRSTMLHILQLILIHPKVVAQFVDDCPADLFADFVLIGADCFNILLVKHDVVGSRRQVKTALFCLRHSVEETQKQPPLLPRLC